MAVQWEARKCPNSILTRMGCTIDTLCSCSKVSKLELIKPDNRVVVMHESCSIATLATSGRTCWRGECKGRFKILFCMYVCMHVCMCMYVYGIPHMRHRSRCSIWHTTYASQAQRLNMTCRICVTGPGVQYGIPHMRHRPRG